MGSMCPFCHTIFYPYIVKKSRVKLRINYVCQLKNMCLFVCLFVCVFFKNNFGIPIGRLPTSLVKIRIDLADIMSI